MTRILTASFLLAGSLGACADQPSTPTAEPEGTPITATAGGVVQLGSDVTLTIPPGSLAEDTVIAVIRDTAVPGADADGFTPLGTAFRFSPPGTQFALAHPAILRMRFEAAELAAQQLDGRTLELAYYDEALGRYFSIGGDVDWSEGTVTARVEHFTLYLPMATALAIGNNAPTVALQATVPAPIRAGAPVYVRATVRDYDVGGSVAGATLEYRQAGAPAFASVPMHAEATLDTFAAVIPAGAFVQGAGNDLEYRVTAYDNLGATAASATVGVDVARSYIAGSLNLTPGTQAIAAGFDRLFTVRGVDDVGAVFSLVPESASATRGSVAISTTGVTFSARTVGSGQVTVRSGADIANAIVNVSNGALQSISILDDFGQPIVGTPIVHAGTRIQLDVVGHDAWGNQVLVTPTWTADSTVPFVSQTGLVDTLDGFGGGSVRATVGNVVGSQAIQVNARAWGISAGLGSNSSLGALTTRNGRPYLIYRFNDGANYRLFVLHHDGETWVSDGSPCAPHPGINAVAIGAGASRLQVAWAEDTTLRTAHLDGTTWVQDGTLNVDPLNDSFLGVTEQIRIEFDGETPWIVFHENIADHLSVFVRRWNGSGWTLEGGQVQDVGMLGSDPQISFLAGVPYIAYAEGTSSGPSQVRVKRFTGTSWQALGGSLNFYPGFHGYPTGLATCGGTPTVLFLNYASIASPYLGVYARRWDGTTWQPLLGSAAALNAGSYDYVPRSSLACDGEILYASWVESQLPVGSVVRERVSAFNPHVNEWTNQTVRTSGLADGISVTMVGTTPYYYHQGAVFVGQ